ncbi:MAG: rRNA pseudouridine synthase [Actinomycetota bacterium]|nr:rRNA pseudouridine synthase [Actinomycetota bacterium]
MRLAKFLAGAGVASRRAAEEIVRAGRVTVDGAEVLDPARGVTEANTITVDDRPVTTESDHVVYAINKPAGVVSTASDPQGRPTIISLVRSPLRLYPVGRLDIDTTGLILVTNDGALAHRLLHPSFEVARTYRARVWKAPISQSAITALRLGVRLDDGLTLPAEVRRLAPDRLEITLHEGRKRQVKRMCEHVGHRVRSLERVAFGPLVLGTLAPGTSRRLSTAEVRALTQPVSRAPAGGARTSSRPTRGRKPAARPHRRSAT